MIRTLIAAVAVAGLFAGAHAAPLLSDGSVTIVNGSGQTGGGNRYDPDNMFDNDPDSFYSLGIGGSVQIDLYSGLWFDNEASVFEVTWNNRGSYPEAAEVLWGTNGVLDGATRGILANTTVTNPAFSGLVINPDIEVVNDNDLMSWTFSVPTAFQYNTLFIGDVTRDVFSSGVSYDGFDVGEIRYATTAVPEPSSIALLGIGMVSLFGFARKRKK